MNLYLIRSIADEDFQVNVGLNSFLLGILDIFHYSGLGISA
jgi:hypothetical protein